MTAEKLGIGVIGAGLWGTHHAHVFGRLPQTKLVAVCDVDESRAAALAREHGAETSYGDHHDLLADAGIQAVSIATPDFAHAELILDAISAGKHVLTEKPLATTVAEAERLHEAARESGLKCMVDFHNRVNPAYVSVKAAIEDNEIGVPQHISARLSNTTFVPMEMLSWAAESSALWFLGSHVVDLLRFILDDDVRRVYAVSRKGVLESRGVDTDDFHLALLEFKKGAAVALENSWLLSPDGPSVVDFGMRIVGATGQLQVDFSHSGTFSKIAGAGVKYADLLGVTPVAGDRIGGFVRESVARFADCVLDDAPPLASFHDGLVATRILAAIEQSARSGVAVDLDG